MLSWNLIGILIWVVLILYLVFIIQNIRKRRIKMIIKEHKRFTWPIFLIDIIEILLFIFAGVWMINQCLFDDPALNDSNRIVSQVKYEPLIMSTHSSGNSSYVTISNPKKKMGVQTYTFYSAGTRMKISSNYGSVTFGKSPLDVNSEKIPYSKKELLKKDRQYQRAYVAIYTAKYRKNWQNGIGLHAGRIATRYYLIRIPDESFIKQEK